MTFSAPAFSEKMISAMTVGWALIKRQDKISPPIEDIEASMSDAVVPGAKLLAMTVNGPAAPRMVNPPPPPDEVEPRIFIIVISSPVVAVAPFVLPSDCNAA